MAKKYDNEFKVMIVELLKSGSKPKQLGEEYELNSGMIGYWRREFAAKSEYFSKKKVLSSI
jgi:transposase